MADQEEYEQQLHILKAHRRTLAHYLEQKATFSVGHVPAHIGAGIQEARQEIAQIKRTIRGWGFSVDNNPMDSDSINTSLPRQSLESPKPKTKNTSTQSRQKKDIFKYIKVVES